MGEIKTIKKETDFSSLKISKMGWDTYCYGKYYDVYRIDGYNHSIGGKWGENCLWACPMDEKPSYDNLIQFSGEPCSWGINIKATSNIKTKWEDTEMRSTFICEIIRNDKVFYSFNANDMDYGLTKARQILFNLNEHPINFNGRNFEKELIGRKIYWREQPATIVSYSMNGNLIIKPATNNPFKKCCYDDNVEEDMNIDDDEFDGDIAEDLLAPSIYWFRSNNYKKR